MKIIQTKPIMKKSYFITFFLTAIFTNCVFAQSELFRPFKVDTGIEFNISTNEEASNGMGFYISPIYNPTDRLSIGPRFGFGYTGSGTINLGIGSVEVGATHMFSFLMLVDYYLSTERVRPFVGMGIGMYKRSEATIKTSIGLVDISRNAKSNFGVKPRVGLNVGHFKMSVDYNFTGDQIYDYIGFTLGVDIGGGFQ